MKTLLCFALLFSCQAAALEPAMKALMDDSPIIVVAEPVMENGMPPLGESSEAVLVKYSVKFRLQKILKSDREMKVGDLIFTRLAVYMEARGESDFQLKAGHAKILFLRKTAYEKDSFENTSLWFGVMPHTQMREMRLGLDAQAAADVKAR